MLRLAHIDPDKLAEEDALAIPFDAPAKHCDDILRLVAKGFASVCAVEDCEGCRVGSLFYQVEQGFSRELVVIGLVGKIGAAGKIPLEAEITATVRKLAVLENCTSARFHTMRAGMQKVALRQGWRISEVIMRLDLTQN
jgi:hypothetical protein